MDARGADRLGAALAAGAALAPLVALYGYTVDDALISARVAHHVAIGIGYRFNAGGPVVDAVTPLGWAYVLAPLARSGVIATLEHAKQLGAAAWLVAATGLGVAIARTGQRASRFSPLLVLSLCAPIAAWAASGMETGVVTALATLALHESRWGALAAGIAAAWRPELIPWALVLVPGTRLAARAPRRELAIGTLLLMAPVLGVVAARVTAFGTPAPLALLAKPSDLEHGFRYAVGALAFSGPPWLLLAPRALARIAPRLRVVALAFAVHLVALTLAGGDWMALWRLQVPVLPGLLLVAAAIADEAPLWATIARTAVASAVCAVVGVYLGPQSARVGAHRRALIASARPVLAGATRVAAVDVGWVGAATDGDVVDLAGVTDREIASLPGGHTSKRIPEHLLESRRVDAVVLLLAADERPGVEWWTSRFAPYAVDSRAAGEAHALGFRAASTLALGGTHQRYLILRRTTP